MKTLNFNAKKTAINSASVLQRRHSIPIEVKKIYTDTLGAVIDKADAIVPVAMQSYFPVFLLGEFDRIGGYAIGQKNKPVAPGVKFIASFVNGATGFPQMIFGFSGANDIQNYIRVGDIVCVYTDDVQNPSVYVWLIVTNNYASIASILGNSKSTQNDSRLGPLRVYEINYKTDLDAQLNEALHLTRYDNLGTYKDDQIQPKGMFRTPNDVQQNLVRMTVDFNIDQFLGINFYMVYDSDSITFDFKIKR
jgi:hypothetical protein